MKKYNYQDLIVQHLSGNISPEDKQQLFAWMEKNEANKTEFEETKTLWDISADYSDPFETNVDAAWTKFEKNIEITEASTPTIKKETAKVRSLSSYKRVLQIAAAFLIGMTAFMWYFNNGTTSNDGGTDGPIATIEMQSYQTGEDEKQVYTLPDGSKVWLNENSKISYNKDFEKRLINLEGEAFFNVEKQNGKQFEIRSGVAKTVVLGTSFNVRAYTQEDVIEVTVSTGKVAFSPQDKPEAAVLLTAGNAGVINKKEANQATKKVDNKVVNAISWKTEKLIFDNTKLSEVAENLERHFDIKINALDKKIMNCRLTGTYENPKLDELLKVLNFALEIEVKKEKNQYVFSGEGCD